ncbi:MAG: PilZ domain-containing protein [Rhizobiaceae bacterium]
MFNSTVRRGRPTGPRKHVERREERIEKTKSASISIDGGDQQMACTVRDIHSSGARLSIMNAQAVADSFLLIVRAENVIARCKVAWRKTNEMGVRFLRVGDLGEEDRMRKEQQYAFQQQVEQDQRRKDEAMQIAEQDRQAKLRDQAQRIAQIRSARMQIMGMDPTQPYSELELKSAFRKQALVNHPDQGGDPVEFQQLTKIYDLMLQDLEVQAAHQVSEAG